MVEVVVVEDIFVVVGAVVEVGCCCLGLGSKMGLRWVLSELSLLI